ncbi:ATP-binding cassette, subfamily B [Tissierella praeacuta DSM 18095]|uniref:ATP-binding cassette, subfamily B n=1 Tax=Tissierella praeacuta DSM 18095 TaxID=1123404 RepID=A0A1M4YC87_9FIRM|nr:ABC transporter ATP-binding protein [Tissierella praeacuta]SHF03451.1 ATP-binding cassette, subfamily B [Tissierella praeacuta DSM 18095]SUP03187.1 Putative multidrug export ATP-binding/permease protein SAV1866 [Tissierella praeacuta]
MKDFKKLLKFMEGYRIIYLFGMISILISQILTTVTPLILRTTIDSIIGDEVIKSSIIQRIVYFLGGKEFLKQHLWLIGLLLVCIAILRGLFLYLKNTLSSKSAENTTKKIRDKLYDHIQRLPYEYHVKAETGELIQKCTSDVDTIRRFLAIQLVEVVGSIFMLVFIIYVMFTMNIKMTMVSIIILPITFLFSFIFFTKIKKAFESSDEAEARMTTTLQENLTGVRVVKAFSRQRYEVDKFDKKNLEYQNLTYKLIKNLSAYWAISDFLSMCQVAFVVIIGSYLAYKGELSLGVFVAFISYINMIIWPVRQMGRTLTDMGKAFVSLQRIEKIFEEPIELLDENNNKPEIKGNIKFEKVYFEYEENKPVLSDLSFEVKVGETIALIGPTGSGKSSLVHLLPRLYEYNKGSIKIDGVELNKIDKSWIRKNVGLVLQEPFLYAKTIKENIKLANPSMKDARVFNAAKIASIHEDIKTFENGYETLVGERGVSLSGGQKQRMAIARTIINDCPIVIFDDSLSAVDTETDISIRKALNNRKNKSTTFIISHRISTVAEADLILVIDKGKIVQRGTHSNLISKEGLYKRIYNLQNSLDDEIINV